MSGQTKATVKVTADMTRQAAAEVGELLNAGHSLHLIAIEMAAEVLRLNAVIDQYENGGHQ